MAGDDARLPFVGLTGGIGAGKSEALAALEGLGAATLSADAVVHELLVSDEVRDELTARLGDAVAPGGEVDRAKVAEAVFGDDERRKWLEGILWPRVGKRIAGWREDLQDRPEPPRAAVVEVPLLFEAGMEAGFDATIAVVADEETRRERAEARGHAGLASRTARQLPQEEKAQRADYAVRNDGTLEELKRKLSEVLGRIESS
ncbi:MAG: dephospho-CoA kinase [Thermoleophilaceae bacterium]|jgi:dephospho-CoA kinase|nr:dephospho-CoA kinase [Thermoleophilaceae bacterium]